jgi:hypothetical protein
LGSMQANEEHQRSQHHCMGSMQVRSIKTTRNQANKPTS